MSIKCNMDLELIPNVGEGAEPKIRFEDKMIGGEVSFSPLFTSGLISGILNPTWRVGVACWGEGASPVNRSRGVCASISSEALVNINLQHPDASEPPCGLFELSRVLRCSIRPDEPGQMSDEPDGEGSRWGSLGTAVPLASLSLLQHNVFGG